MVEDLEWRTIASQAEVVLKMLARIVFLKQSLPVKVAFVKSRRLESFKRTLGRTGFYFDM